MPVINCSCGDRSPMRYRATRNRLQPIRRLPSRTPSLRLRSTARDGRRMPRPNAPRLPNLLLQNDSMDRKGTMSKLNRHCARVGFRGWIGLLGLVLLTSIATGLHAQDRWTEEQANAWYARQPWPVGANFLPSTAINELEMWQAETFDTATIDRELGWAEGIGMNTMRVFLHNLLWEQDPEGFKKRIDEFLTIAARHHIRPIFVLFDSCWDPFPKLGPQHPPIPGVHNSGWVQAPGAKILADSSQYPQLESYVKGVVGGFANDQRILAWDVWNEPDNGNDGSYGKGDPR